MRVQILDFAKRFKKRRSSMKFFALKVWRDRKVMKVIMEEKRDLYRIGRKIVLFPVKRSVYIGYRGKVTKVIMQEKRSLFRMGRKSVFFLLFFSLSCQKLARPTNDNQTRVSILATNIEASFRRQIFYTQKNFWQSLRITICGGDKHINSTRQPNSRI